MTETGSRLRVAQLVETLAAGGAETLAVGIAAALAERGHESHLIVLKGDGPLRERVPKNVVLHDLAQTGPRGGQVARVRRFAANIGRVRSILRSSGVTVLQSHLPMANFICLSLAWRRECLTFPTVHNNRELDYGDDAGRLRRALRRQGYRLMVGHCTKTVAVSEQVCESLVAQLALGPAARDRIEVVQNGVVIPALVSEAERAQARKSWGVPQDAVLFVAVGRMTRQKNFGSLVGALARISDLGVDWRCVIAGEGELRDELAGEIAAAGLTGRIALPGMVADVRALLAAADVFCLSSLFEGLPLALLEAMAHNLPVAAFAIDGVVEVVQDGRHGRLAAPGDVAGLAGALAELASDASRRAELGREAGLRIRGHYDFAFTVDRLEPIYRDRGSREA